MNLHSSNYINWKMLILVTVSLFSMHSNAFAQGNGSKHRTYLGIEFSQSEAQKMLTASLTARIEGERGRKRIEDANIKFYSISDTSEILLGEAVTDIDGDAILEIPESSILELNSDGELVFKAVFSGDNEFQKVSKEIAVRPMKLEMSFIEIDSIKNIGVSAYELEENGEKIPVEEDVDFFVPRQFSQLKIGEVELEDGEGMIEFPVTLPGDSIGNLKIIARIQESRDYGTIEAVAIKDWGQVRPPVVIEPRRGLGDTDAPLWMVYTLIILMSAVWFHYMYLIYVMVSIKRKGKMLV